MYTVDLSVNLRKHTNLSYIKDEIASIAFDCGGEIINFIYETEGPGNKIEKNDCICVIHIGDNENRLLHFIKHIKPLKYIHIDCIYIDNNKIEMLYMSKKYRQKSDLLKQPSSHSKKEKDHIHTDLCNKIKDLINKISK